MTSTILLQLGLSIIMIVVGIYVAVSSINEGKDDSLSRHSRFQQAQEREVRSRTNRPRPESSGVNTRKIAVISIACIIVLTSVSVIVGMTAAFRRNSHTVTAEHEEEFEEASVLTDYDQLEEGWSYIDGDRTVQIKKTEYGEPEAMKLFDEDTGELWYYSTVTPQGNPLQSRYYENGEVDFYIVYTYEVMEDGTERRRYEVWFDSDHGITSFEKYDSDEDESEYTEIPEDEYDEYEMIYDEDGFVCDVEEIE